MIELRHLRKEYEGVTPLADVSATIADGDVVSVIGPSGTGKSTLLRCINMLERPTSGQVVIDGVDVCDPACDLGRVRQKTGMVFQSFNLFGHLTAVENVMVAQVDLLGRTRQQAYDESMRLLRSVGLAGRALAYPDELSGGQRQRVAIARTLAMDPDTILLDEPTSALDPTMVGEVQAVIRSLAKTGKTMMIVTHEMAFARAICNRVFYMDQGVVYEEGTPEQVFERPRRELTRRFIRNLKVLELQVSDPAYDFLGAITEIERYADRSQMPPRLASRLELAFEEGVQQLVLPALGGRAEARFVVEYSERDGVARVRVEYGGAPRDLTGGADALSLAVLRGASENLSWSYDDLRGMNVISLDVAG